jgi:hypothetical protein
MRLSEQEDVIHNFGFKRSELKYGLMQSYRDNMLGPEMPKNITAEQLRAHRIAEVSLTGSLPKRRPQAFLNPAVSFVLDAAFMTLETQGIKKRLRGITEVQYRAVVGRGCANLMTTSAVDAELLARQFRGDSIRLGLSTDGNRLSVQEMMRLDILSDRDSGGEINSLPRAVFSDASIVAGGALNALHNAGIHNDERAIIAHSSALLKVAGAATEVVNDGTQTVNKLNVLGVPYFSADNFVISESMGAAPYEVSYTKETLDYIHSLYAKERGCPAQGVHAVEGRASLLEESWQRAVGFLVVAGATADMAS